MEVLELLGARIRRLREIKGLTQKELADRCESDSAYIGALERGQKNATVKILKKISEGLEVELFSLFAFDSVTIAPSRKQIKQLIDNIPDEKLIALMKVVEAL